MKIPTADFDYDRVLGPAYACLLFITGGICVYTGCLAEDVYLKYSIFTSLNLLVTSSILSIAGNLIILAGVLCLCAAFKRNRWLIIIIGLLLGVAISMELSASISGNAFNSKTHHHVERKMYESMKHYHYGDSKVVHTWDRLQKKFQCCGALNITDWSHVKKSIPTSCCALKPEDALDPYICAEYYADGCASIVSYFITERATKASKMGIIAAIVQFTGLSAILFAHAFLEYLDKKDRNRDTSFFKSNLDVFTIDPYYTKLEK